jgi:thymidylate synthase (FAD)
MIDVLDKGYVKLVTHMGSDIDVVNSARVSFDKEVQSLDIKDLGLIDYLVKNKHDACFRHCALTFEVYAPLMVARQWYKHAVGSVHLEDQFGWNESSRRYVTENEEFYVPAPDAWRSAAANKKQGSGDNIDVNIGVKYTQRLRASIERGVLDYQAALDDGVAPEQARLLLPAYGMYVRWRWTTSLNGALHFLSLRLDSHAQWEIQQYAKAVEKSVHQYFPVTYDAWTKHRL